MNAAAPLGVLEFFAGGGMARLGLDGWRTLLANDIDPAKAAAYRANFGDSALKVADVWTLTPADIPGRADLAWASSPCQDLSLAGARAGLAGARSSAFWGFWRLIRALDAEGRAPRAIVIENVCGLLTSAGGADFRALAEALAADGWRYGALEIDAAYWLPQSRPRLFVVATREPPGDLAGPGPDGPFHGRGVRAAFEALPEPLKARWLWWRLPAPPRRNTDLAALLEPDEAVTWFDAGRTARLLEMMSPLQRARLDAALTAGGRRVGAAYRRVRREDSRRVQRLEARFDGLAGCLRTPAGGSSRQFVLVVEDGRVRARLLTPREAARLMGLPEDYRLPAATGAALKVAGDGVAVPVVAALSAQLLRPLVGSRGRRAA